jgi:CheY-like chemotaxis protein
VSGEIKVLLVDDDAEKRFLIAHHITKVFTDVEVSLVECDCGATAIAHLEKDRVDALVTDNSMSPVNGIELIKWLRERDRALPVIMVTGNPEIEKAAVKAGASVVLASQQFSEVGAVLKNLLQQAP